MLPVCAPSWVIAGSLAENAAFLEGNVYSAMACLFEHAPALPNPLPSAPGRLLWHVHLPTDLPWNEGGSQAGIRACSVMDSMRHLLQPESMAVLHAPPSLEALQHFMREWANAGWKAKQLVLENIPEADVFALPPLCEKTGAGLCLDAAHLALFGNLSHAVGDSALLARVRMVHWSAPIGRHDAHAPLDQLAAEHLPTYRMLAQHSTNSVDVLEIFDWQGLLASWDTLRTWRNGHVSTALSADNR